MPVLMRPRGKMETDVRIRGIDSRRTEISQGGWKAVIIKRAHPHDQQWKSKTRVYGAIATFAPELDEKVDKNTSKPVWGEGDGLTDEARAAHLKEYGRLKREAVESAKLALAGPIAVLHVQLGIPLSDPPTANFSARAGCSMCQCSPGYILSTRWTLNGTPVDVWFEQIDTDPKAI